MTDQKFLPTLNPISNSSFKIPTVAEFEFSDTRNLGSGSEAPIFRVELESGSETAKISEVGGRN